MKAQQPTHTGLLFGSFNPVHTGHLIIAQYFIQYTSIEEVWFVLSPQNPFKTDESMLDEQSRMQLLQKAIDGNDRFRLCDVELDMPLPSYTINTLKKIQETYPEKLFTLLIGSDNLASFDQWKDYRDILSLVNVYVYPRPDTDDTAFASHPSVTLTGAPRLEISSTRIREAIMEGKEPRYLVPEPVLKMIKESGYYNRL